MERLNRDQGRGLNREIGEEGKGENMERDN